MAREAEQGLPASSSVLAVCAHPDDESFGLGAVLSAFVAGGTRAAVLCLTHGEASTLGVTGTDLARLRAAELVAASAELGVSDHRLLAYPDGGLAALPAPELAGEVVAMAGHVGADLLLVFDDGGVTGHPDHQAATESARLASRSCGLAVLAWALPAGVARTLNAEVGASFVGRAPREIDLTLAVDRTRQLAAIRCHASQSGDNRVLWRRLELQGDTEALRWLRRRS